MSAGRESVLIVQMLECIQAVEEYVRHITAEEFLKDRKTQDAVFMRIMALSELAGKLLKADPSLEDRYPGMQWPQLTGLRNRIAHDYFGVVPSMVWRAIEERLPRTAALLGDMRDEIRSA